MPHEVELKYGASRVLLKPAAPGTGIIAGGVVRTIIGVTSVKNLVSKSIGSTNKVNVAYATIKALSEISHALNGLATKRRRRRSNGKIS